VWYELPSFYVFHIANAWEEGGKVKMVACQAERVDLNAMKFNEDMGENLGVNFGAEIVHSVVSNSRIFNLWPSGEKKSSAIMCLCRCQTYICTNSFALVGPRADGVDAMA
jgi:hypothetical protein